MAELIMAEGAAPATPATGKATIHIDTSGNLCKTDDAGNTMVLVCAGDFTFTIPATGTAALLGRDQTFTETNTFAPAGTASGDRPVYIQMPSGATANALRVDYISDNGLTITQVAATSNLAVNGRNLGNNVAGPTVLISRNTNGGAEGGAAGTLQQAQGDGTARYLWPDASGQYRIHTAAPTGSTGTPTVSDTAGVVVGTQTSMAEAKLISDDLSVLDEVMARVHAGAEAVRRFSYRSGAFGGQEFEGVVTDHAPEYGMDRDAEHPQGKSLCEVTILGDLLRTVDWLVQRVRELEQSR